MALPSEKSIRKQMELLIPQIDINEITIKQFVKMLSEKMGTNLKEKKKFIKSTLTEILDQIEQEKENENEEVASNSSEAADSGSDESDDDDDFVEKKPKKVGGLNMPKKLSPELAQFLGKRKESRPQVVKALWAYFKENDLQNPKDKREIILDAKLRAVFNVDKVTMFTLNKYVGAHIDPFKPVQLDNSTGSSERSSRKRKQQQKERGKSSKPAKKRKAGTQPAYWLSDDLKRVVGKPILPRPQVTKALWAYIRENNLQNPNDKRQIICDDDLKKVMGGCKKVTMFSMNKHISKHLIEKAEKGEYVHEESSDDDSSE